MLDLGCGYGALSALFAAEGASVIGIDIASERVSVGNQIAHEHGLQVLLRSGRLEAPPVAHACFDLALLNNSLCYLVDCDARERCLEEAYRALRPGGFVIVRDPNRLHPRDNFTGWWCIGMLPHQTATVLTKAAGTRRSRVRLRTPHGARAELSQWASATRGTLPMAAPSGEG